MQRAILVFRRSLKSVFGGVDSSQEQRIERPGSDRMAVASKNGLRSLARSVWVAVGLISATSSNSPRTQYQHNGKSSSLSMSVITVTVCLCYRTAYGDGRSASDGNALVAAITTICFSCEIYPLM